MAIKITSAIYVNGTNFTPYLVQPIKWGNFLDERLDEAYITLVGTKFKAFQPMDKVELVLTLHNKYRNKTTVKRMYYLVANDKTTEEPIGSGRYTHELYCIELTKMLEMYVVDSLTFTNVLARIYKAGTEVMPYENDGFVDDGIPADYSTPQVVGTTLHIISGSTLWASLWVYLGTALIAASVSGTTKVVQNGKVTGQGDCDQAFDVVIEDGSGTIEYHIEYDIQQMGAISHRTRDVTFSFDTIMNGYPSKRITCTDVINRLCDLVTPLFKGESSRFVLDPKDSDDFDKIYCPEITMTQSTLRENLQEVGKIVHGEPRIVPYGFETYKITFDRYGGMNKANKPTKYIEKVSERAIDSYCSSVDSAAQNLVNSLDYATGAIIDPRANASRSVRVDEVYTRIEDTNMKIVLPRQINKVIKLECVYPGRNEYVNVTDFLYEKTAYYSLLSSYSQYYPGSKAYGLYYSISGNTIDGLNFKLDDAFFPEKQKYAIINILEYQTGASIDVSDVNFYPQLRFRVTYVPYFNVRLTQSKPYIREFKEPAALIYNQSANVIESRAYGENLKGAVARLGNPERSITYWLTSFGQIPDAGDLYDDDYYISTVACEMYGIGIRCTLGLTKNFNRKSAYVGVSSERRLYEVSERAAYDRTTLYKEYIIVGDEETSDDTLLGDDFLSAVKNTFTQAAEIERVDHVIAQGEGYDGAKLPSAELSVVSTSIGNTIVFIWNYQDNYSAGAVSSFQQNLDGSVSGYFQDNYQYTDYYGKMYYYHFDLRSSNDTSDGGLNEALALPGTTESPKDSGIFSTEAHQPYIYRKDSREISQFCAEVEFVTNRKDLIIGSALAARNGLVGAQAQDPVRLYFLPFEVNKFATKITTDLTDVPYLEPAVYDANLEYGEYQLTTSPPSADTIVYKDFYTDGEHIILRNPVTYSSLPADSPGFYVQNSDFSTDSTVVTSAYECISAGSSGVMLRTMTIVPVKGEGGYAVQQTGKQVIVTVLGDIPACKSWAFITPQYTTTQTVEDDEGHVSEQTYYEGGEVLLACNTPLSAGDTIPPIYFTAVHDPFKRFEIDYNPGFTVSFLQSTIGYAYQRYDELINKFILDNKTIDVMTAPIGTKFYSVEEHAFEDRIGTTLYEFTIKSRGNNGATSCSRYDITRKGGV